MSDEGTYELLPTGPGVPEGLPGGVRLCSDAFEALDGAAADLFVHACGAVKERGEFHLALSATPTTARLVWQMMIDPGMREVPWKQTRVWLAEERLDEGPRSAQVFGELLLDHSGMAREHFHGFDPRAEQDVDACERRLQERVFARGGAGGLDFVLLGLDGGWSVCSPVTEDGGRVYVPAPGMVRMTPRVLGSASLVALVGAGAEAWGALESAARCARGEGGAARASDQLHSASARLKWYVGGDGTEGNVNA